MLPGDALIRRSSIRRGLPVSVVALLASGLFALQTVADEADEAVAPTANDAPMTVTSASGETGSFLATTAPAGVPTTTAASHASTTTTALSEPPPMPTTTAGPPETEGWEYGVHLSATCAAIGDSMTITLYVSPYAQVLVVAYYPDGGGRPPRTGAIAPPNGKYTLTWMVPDDAPPGDVNVTTQAYDSGQRRKGMKNVGFRVVDRGQSC